MPNKTPRGRAGASLDAPQCEALRVMRDTVRRPWHRSAASLGKSRI